MLCVLLIPGHAVCVVCFFRMAVAAAQKPMDEDLKVPKEPEAEEEDDDDDEVAKLQAIQEEQNAQWQQYVARINQCKCTLP